VFAGSGEFGLPSLRALRERHEVAAVYTQPDRPAGRGRKLTPTPVGAYCLGEGVAVVATADLNAETLPACDVLVVIAFGQKIAEWVTKWPTLGAVNLHASRLPRYRGAAPIHRAIMAGETVTGNSIIRLAEKMDAGAVLGMSEVAIGELETTGELHDRLAMDGAGLLMRVLDDLAAGTAVEMEQDHSAATVAKKISREQAVLDFSRPARELACMVRGLYPWPGCRVEVRGDGGDGLAVLRRLTPVRARALPGSGVPGEILPNWLVGTGDGLLEFVEVQPEGGRPMSISAYRNGHPWPVGGRLRGCL
jgi:methionyl-tRNA formyltransferase